MNVIILITLFLYPSTRAILRGDKILKSYHFNDKIFLLARYINFFNLIHVLRTNKAIKERTQGVINTHNSLSGKGAWRKKVWLKKEQKEQTSLSDVCSKICGYAETLSSQLFLSFF